LRKAGEIVALSSAADILGESPLWHAAEQALYWVDVRGEALRRLDLAQGGIRHWDLPELVGCVVLRAGGGVLLALRSGIAALDLVSGAIKMLAAPYADLPDMRFNDGRCDRQGRLWAGSMNDVTRAPVGLLYRFDRDGLTPVLDQVAIPNSLCWSPDGGTMYFSDGREPVIHSFSYDTVAGIPSQRREFARLPDGSGVPDGAAIDAEGFLWTAIYGGGAVNRYAPDGRLDFVLPLPVSQPTSCAFGGADFETLFITTARQRLPDEALQAQPLAGALLAIQVDARGLPEPEFRG